MKRYMNRFRQLFMWYGPSAIPLFIFGSHTTWCMQAKVLGELRLREGQDRPDNSRAIEFKSSTLAKCNMVAVAAAVIAQIAMTGLPLKLSNQTNCLTKASFVLSLVFAILAVFHACCLQLKFNRLHTGEDIRRWIRGSSRKPDAKRWGWSVNEEINARYFTPSVSSVITASTPQMLLSISLAMLAIALGMYLGHFGTAEPKGTKCVFVLYIVWLILSGGVYSIAQSFDIEEVRSEIDIVNGYLAEWKSNSPGQDIDNRHRPQTAEIAKKMDGNFEFDPLLTEAGISGGISFAIIESTGRNSPTTSRSERRRRDQAKGSQPSDLETGNMEDSISQSGSEASSRSKSSIKDKERVGKKD